ncbi:molybdate ABC transporter substrate-binding protein [Cytophagaceae bacterium YF14B1]|uniref:Molybdate ABC transporter substrate-binding protein n=1 Tax=Xanthocytophaga flava TaxID=3048013 RepID=A0AAE3QUD1_9BACT|nr:molybdate ABC transporter substrate-binding protein [Xanthocytophaga flavus]MDJ1485151.1 molybdate ABC transporter substrate-binding protein [Xanthocytophaga flavus]
MKYTILGLLVFLLFAHGVSPVKYSTPQEEEITIAAASDLRFAMDSLVTVFKKTYPSYKVTVIYGSSGKFFHQISNGAPFDIFFSADKEYPLQLQEKKLTASSVNLYAIGKLVLWSKKLNPVTKGMNTVLDPSVKKIAIANPEHAPYGKKAKESLIHYKLYDKIKSKLVLGENISQTAQYISVGAADIGIVALSLVMSPELQNQGKYYVIPDTTHTPLEQAYVILKRGEKKKGTQLFSTFISSPSAKSLLQKFGFSLPK